MYRLSFSLLFFSLQIPFYLGLGKPAVDPTVLADQLIAEEEKNNTNNSNRSSRSNSFDKKSKNKSKKKKDTSGNSLDSSDGSKGFSKKTSEPNLAPKYKSLGLEESYDNDLFQVNKKEKEKGTFKFLNFLCFLLRKNFL